MKPAHLRVNNVCFEGLAPSHQSGQYPGEIVFTTGMTGYPETLTDPSYAGQIVVFTYPIIGNYGIPSKDKWESGKIYAAGVVVSDLCTNPSHYQSESSLADWLKSQDIPLIVGVDTRAVTLHLRNQGTVMGKMDCGQGPDRKELDYKNLLDLVSIKEPLSHGKGTKRVMAIDCGMKSNITRHLLARGIEVVQCPYNYDFTNEKYDGVFLSNGPGDPADCHETLAIVKKTLEKNKPVFGICLGSQLMGLAAGAKTHKLKFGHRGHNQPCLHHKDNTAYLTSQNHGYAIENNTLSSDWEITFTNLNDNSIEGIAHKTKPFFSVQFHPEAAPGPHDTNFLFDQFVSLL